MDIDYILNPNHWERTVLDAKHTIAGYTGDYEKLLWILSRKQVNIGNIKAVEFIDGSIAIYEYGKKKNSFSCMLSFQDWLKKYGYKI